MKRFALFVLSALVSSSAFASFEMLLVTDKGTDRVERFDPISGSYLGNFGGGFLTDPSGVVIDRSTSTAYVMDSSTRVSSWDYNTGAFKSSWLCAAPANFLTGNPDGTLNVICGNVAVRYNTLGVSQQVYNITTGLTGQQAILSGDGNLYISTRTGTAGGIMQRFNYTSGALVGTSTWYADRVISAGGNNMIECYTYAGQIYFERDIFFNGPSSSGDIGSTALTNAAGIAAGHSGLFYATGQLTSAPSTGAIIRFDNNTGLIGGTFGNNVLVTPSGMASVVAPEPGTWAALGLGAISLLRRSRRTRG